MSVFEESTHLPTEYGSLRVAHFQISDIPGECIVLYKPPIAVHPFVRFHSACLFAEAFRSNLCDCKAQLEYSLSVLAAEGGYLFYLFQEGRGIGLRNKIRSMEIERVEQVDSFQAFARLGFRADLRTYDLAVAAMKRLGVPREIVTFTNNTHKIDALQKAGFRIVRQITSPAEYRRD